MQAVGVTTMLPAADVEFQGTFTPEGYVPPKGAGLNLAWIPQVMGNYFQAQGIPIIRGRDFTPADDATALRWSSSSTAPWQNTTGPARIPSANACTAAQRKQTYPG